MNIIENIYSAIFNIFSNKMRTFLTMLGIIIGVSSVITITSLGDGFKNGIQKNFEILNSKALQIMVNWGAELTPKDKIYEDDVKALKELDIIKYSSGYNSTSAGVKMKNPEDEKNIAVIASEPEFAYMQKNFFTLKYGRTFTERENEIKSKVCLIDEKLAFDVFGRKNVVGQEINLYINNMDYKFNIIGVTDGEINSFMGSMIQIPLGTYLDIFNTKEISMIYAELKDTSNIARDKNQISRVLAARHNTTDDKYMALSNLEQVKQVDKVINLFTIFIGVVAGISLLVGGIGVMNIMLVTVTERTREIGIRKSLGATEKDIKTQFLIESMFMCALGGLIGIAVGYIVSIIMGKVLGGYFEQIMGIKNIVPQLSMIVAFGAMIISTIVGVIFGVYPAGKAAKLNPIEALRYE